MNKSTLKWSGIIFLLLWNSSLLFISGCTVPRDFSEYMKNIEFNKNAEVAKKAFVDKKYIETIQALEKNEILLRESGDKNWSYYNTIYILAVCHEHLKDYKKSKELYSQVIEGLHNLGNTGTDYALNRFLR